MIDKIITTFAVLTVFNLLGTICWTYSPNTTKIEHTIENILIWAFILSFLGFFGSVLVGICI